MGTTIESSWENTRLADQCAMLRNALVDCERVGELLAYYGHKEPAQRIFDVVSTALGRSIGNGDNEQVGWIARLERTNRKEAEMETTQMSHTQAMTVDEALERADEWIKGVTLYDGLQGWRVACHTLATEVRRLRRLVDQANGAAAVQWED